MIKRLFDIGIVLFFLPLLLPLTVIISLILFINQGTPIIFIQNRVGKDNKIFKLYKYLKRSLVSFLFYVERYSL